jgi:hypothetical protein
MAVNCPKQLGFFTKQSQYTTVQVQEQEENRNWEQRLMALPMAHWDKLCISSALILSFWAVTSWQLITGDRVWMDFKFHQ